MAEALLAKLSAQLGEAGPEALIEVKLAVAQLPADSVLARDLLEQGAWVALKNNSTTDFERFLDQLKPFYAAAVQPASSHMPALLGLNLMRLLSVKDLSTFHTERELLSPVVRESEYVEFAHRLERFLSEGAYHKMLGVERASAPDKAYLPFLDKLNESIRDEVADCMEGSFAPVAVAEAGKLLFISDGDDAVRAFAAKRGWTVTDGGDVVFKAAGEVSHKDTENSFTLIRRSLQYAGEMERIV